MKKFLGIVLSLILISAFALTGCAENTASVEDNCVGIVYNAGATNATIELDIDNLPILKGDTYKVSPTVYVNNAVLNGATFEYQSSNPAVAQVSGNVVTGVEFGTAIITVTVNYKGYVIATKELTCEVNNNNAIYTNKKSYELYTMSSVLTASFDTTETILTTMYNNGVKIEGYGNLEWASGNTSVVTISNKGVLTAVGEGETYVYGSYSIGDVDLQTRRIPVKISKPYLKTETDVLFEKTAGTGTFDATKVLGSGYSVGKVVDVNTKKEFSVSGNSINLTTVESGDYRFAIYEANGRFATEVNVIVADYIIDNLAEFKSGEWYSRKYVALNTDLTSVGRFLPDLGTVPDFSGTFNGMGHKITGIRYWYNNHAIFGSVWNSTIKNLAVKCTISDGRYRQGALFYRGINVTVDNVYVETVFEGECAQCGGLGDIILTAFNVKHTIVKTSGATDSTSFGAIIARSGVVKIGYTNAYFISPLKLCATFEDPSNTKYDFINGASLGVAFDNDEEFLAAIGHGEVSFEGYNHYWDLSGEVPVFKSLKD